MNRSTPTIDPEEAIGDLDGARAGTFCLLVAFFTFLCFAFASLGVFRGLARLFHRTP